MAYLLGAGRRGAVRAQFIAVAAAWSARRGAAVRARRRRVPRRGRQGAVAGGNWEAGGHVRLWFWAPGWNMEGGGCGFGGHRPHTEASSAQTCSFFLRPSTVEGANTLFDTVDALFGTVDRESVGNEEGANLLLLPPLWSALGERKKHGSIVANQVNISVFHKKNVNISV